ncbi:MAG: CHAD domain-containing protein [Acidobacteria bacterium]|nr:CHAD domain-containing protein [Acidobacteriota bacterium]
MSARPSPSAEAFTQARRLVRAQARVVDARAKAWAMRPGDRDALHDARTALRRLRVLVRSFQAELGPLARKGVRRRLREAFKASSSLRDLDVFTAWLVTLPPSVATRRLLRTADVDAKEQVPDVSARIQRAWRDAHRRLRSSRIDERVTRGPSRPFGAAAARAVRAEVRAVGIGLAHFDPVNAAVEAHQTRIAAKRLRYLLEALSGRSPDSHRAVEWCRAFQDLVGEWRDAALASARVRACPAVAGRDALLRRVSERRRDALVELRRFVADDGAWAIARRDALAIARRHALGSRTSGA